MLSGILGQEVEVRVQPGARFSSPLPGEGGIDVSALPEDAVLFIDGALQPKGLKFIPLAAGKHRLRIELGDNQKELEVEIRDAIAILPADLL